MKFEKVFKEVKKVLFGGVNSFVWVFNFVDVLLVFMDYGKGVYIIDVDGNEYIDYVLFWGFLILGYVDLVVVNVIIKVVLKGISFGMFIEIEIELVKLVIECVLFIEIVCMVLLGMEVMMSVICLVCGYIKREKILKFEGSYYGYGDFLLIKVGLGVVIFGLLDFLGVIKGFVVDIIIVLYNDIEGVELVF